VIPAFLVSYQKLAGEKLAKELEENLRKN